MGTTVIDKPTAVDVYYQSDVDNPTLLSRALFKNAVRVVIDGGLLRGSPAGLTTIQYAFDNPKNVQIFHSGVEFPTEYSYVALVVVHGGQMQGTARPRPKVARRPSAVSYRRAGATKIKGDVVVGESVATELGSAEWAEIE